MNAEEYKAKKEARIERFKELSEKNQNLSDSMLKQAQMMQSVIPLGQPILVGHHSEKSDRNYRNKIDNKIRKALEIDDKASYYAQKAISAENNNAIFSDDPEAVRKLKEEIQSLQDNQELMKKANKIIKTKKTDEEKVEELVEIGLHRSVSKSLLSPDCFGGKGYAGFQLTNNNANINRLKKRLVELEAKTAQETTETIINGISIVENTELNRVQILFPNIPAPEVRTQLKKNGFRWSPTNKAWQRHRSNAATWKANEIVRSLK